MISILLIFQFINFAFCSFECSATENANAACCKATFHCTTCLDADNCATDGCETGYIGDKCNKCAEKYGKLDGDNGAFTCVLKKECIDANMKCQEGNCYDVSAGGSGSADGGAGGSGGADGSGAASTQKCLLCVTGYIGDTCAQCDTNLGYKPSDPNAASVTCVLACPDIPHCKSCETERNKCDEDECVEGYTGDTCNDCLPTHHKIEGTGGAFTCALKKPCTDTTMKCQTGANCYDDAGTEKCSLCVAGYAGATCNECDTDYGKLEGENGAFTCVLKKACTDKNMKCQTGNCYAADDNSEKCLLCNEGYIGDTCSACDTKKGYTAQEDGTCQKPVAPGLDCSSISGCEKCQKEENSDKIICTECKGGEKPTELNTCPLDFAEDTYVPVQIGNAGCTASIDGKSLTIAPDATANGNPSVTISADSSIEKITIENSDTKNLMLNLPGNANIEIVPPTGGKNNAIVNLANGASVKLPEASQKIDIIGNKAITLVPSEAGKPININKIRFDASHKLEKIVSDSNLNINEMDIFGAQKFEGNGKMKCTNLKVEKGATFNPKQISFENARVGLESVLNIDSPINIDHYLVAFNEANTQHIPIRFTGSKPNLDGKDIQLFKQNAASTLAEKKTNLASFEGDKAEDTCKDLKFKENKDVDMKSAKCEKGKNGQYNMVASSKKKGGLNGGAIAGIVIACVVVVAAIIVLLVYFLVIKKKNKSTTSTQGDSSIAI